MECPLHLLRIERIPISLSALPSTTTMTFQPSASSLNVPPLPIPLQCEVPLLNPDFSHLWGDRGPSEVGSNDHISILSDPLQLLVKPQSEDLLTIYKWEPSKYYTYWHCSHCVLVPGYHLLVVVLVGCLPRNFTCIVINILIMYLHILIY